MRYLILLFTALILLPAQDAIVVQLGDADATLMRDLYAQRDNLNLRIEKENDRIGKLYAMWGPGYGSGTASGPQPPLFEYSKDFRFIVPKQTTGTGPSYLTIGPGGLTGRGDTVTPYCFGCYSEGTYPQTPIRFGGTSN